MPQLEQTYVINAPITDVYQALTDAAIAEQWGAGPAKIDAREGGEYSYWDGDIQDEQKDVKDWQDYYFGPIKELLERQSNIDKML